MNNHFQPPIHNPNPNPNHHNHNAYGTFDMSEFEFKFEPSDFLMVEDGSEEDLLSQVVAPTEELAERAMEKSKGEGRIKVAFRTKSELEIMDDGFKWRKYGKKMVKTSPNPRNYYKCSSGGCSVKKRVERDSEDPSYVITTYDGVHNHQCPSLVYYNQSPDHLMVPEAQASWTFQPNSSSHYTSS